MMLVKGYRHGRPIRTAALCAAASLLAACALIGSHPIKSQPPAAAPPEAPPPPPALPLPADTHHFTLPSQQDDVVGEVQVTTASKEDTLPDIARRFDIGYEEIVRANPGVDPWLPGEGRQIVVPTRFVLPNAPREGIVINVEIGRAHV